MDKNLGPASQASHSGFLPGMHNSYRPGARALNPLSSLTMGSSSCCWARFRFLAYLVLLNLSVSLEAAEMPACGKPQQLNRIVGGENAMEAEWPWIVSIQKNGTHHCAGSLITNRWVVTAAHCFKDSKEPSQFSVLLGAWQLGNPGPRATQVGMAWVLPHPKYTWPESNQGDIALVRLDHSIKFSERVLPICLPDSTVKLLPGTSCWIAGWGSIKDGVPLPYPQTLQKLQVPIISSETCSHLYWRGSGQGAITSDMLCAGYLEGKKDACLGDSGGPLMCQVNGSWLLAGIISWGEGCAERDRPGVYISLTAHQAWIQRVVQGAQFQGQPWEDTNDFRPRGGRGV